MASTWKHLLTGSNKSRVIAELQKRISASSVEYSSSNQKQGAVLVPFIINNDEFPDELLFTVRSKQLRSHRGQVSFPGGKADPLDTSPIDTALRETHEELGIQRERWNVWGYLPSLPGKRGVNVSPVIATISDFSREELHLQQTEVDFTFTLSLDHLISQETRRYTLFKNSSYRFPVYLGGPRTIWGLTGFILDYVFSVLLPEEVPFPPHK